MADILAVMRRSVPLQALQPVNDGAGEDGQDNPPPAEAAAPATWLDAMPFREEKPDLSASERTAAVNSDDNGLYRMFRNLAH